MRLCCEAIRVPNECTGTQYLPHLVSMIGLVCFLVTAAQITGKNVATVPLSGSRFRRMALSKAKGSLQDIENG